MSEPEHVLPCAIDGCKQPSQMPASEYCRLHSAIGTKPSGGEFAPQAGNAAPGEPLPPLFNVDAFGRLSPIDPAPDIAALIARLHENADGWGPHNAYGMESAALERQAAAALQSQADAYAQLKAFAAHDAKIAEARVQELERAVVADCPRLCAEYCNEHQTQLALAAAEARVTELEREKRDFMRSTPYERWKQAEAENAALREDAERYRVARTPAFGIADWTMYAKPLVRHGESADARLDAAIARKP